MSNRQAVAVLRRDAVRLANMAAQPKKYSRRNRNIFARAADLMAAEALALLDKELIADGIAC